MGELSVLTGYELGRIAKSIAEIYGMQQKGQGHEVVYDYTQFIAFSPK